MNKDRAIWWLRFGYARLGVILLFAACLQGQTQSSGSPDLQQLKDKLQQLDEQMQELKAQISAAEKTTAPGTAKTTVTVTATGTVPKEGEETVPK